MPFCYCLLLFMPFCYLKKSFILLLAYDVNVNRIIVSVDHKKEQLTLQPSYSLLLRSPQSALVHCFCHTYVFVRIWDANI